MKRKRILGFGILLCTLIITSCEIGKDECFYAWKGSKAYLKLEEVNNREEAEKISKSPTFLPKSSRPRSRRGEFYDDEITGYEVADTILGSLGKITGVVQAGPNKLLAVGYGEKELLIPVNSPFIDAINKSKRQLTVTLPEGFLDI